MAKKARQQKNPKAALPVKPLVPKSRFVRRGVRVNDVIYVVLEELSKQYGHICSYLGVLPLVERGELLEAYKSVRALHAARPDLAETCQGTWLKNQAEAVFKKVVDPNNTDVWAETMLQWYSQERRNRRQNAKMIALLNRRARKEKEIPYKRELYRLYEALVYALGNEPPLDQVYALSAHGPGSTVKVRGKSVHYVRKAEAFDHSSSAREHAVNALVHDKYVWQLLGLDPQYAYLDEAREGFKRCLRERLKTCTGGPDRLMFIHKGINSKRSIGSQPTLNVMLQLGVHGVLSNALARVGIDLGDQSRNAFLALEGSRGWQEADPYVTIDKENASNSFAKNLILLFPPAWSKLLMSLRSHAYEAPQEIGGGTSAYEMYAGMGNGTTFGVETLLFWAMTYAVDPKQRSIEKYVRQHEYAVYGDDVILKRDHAEWYIPFANWLGFRINQEKSFLEGPFRESCGADYYEGVFITPAKLRSETQFVDELALIGFHNTLADQRTYPLDNACKRIRRLWKTHLLPIIPTDPQGNLGFRPTEETPLYDMVRDREGNPIISPVWQRPRGFICDVRPRMDKLSELPVYAQIAVALLRGQQASGGEEFRLPFRDLVNVRVVAEQDLHRKDGYQQLVNVLAKLVLRKQQPWWDHYRGTYGRE